MTTAEILTFALANHLNVGSSTTVEDVALRKRAWFGLVKAGKRVHLAAPHWWRVADGTVVLTAGVGTMPADFSHESTELRVYVSGQQYQEVVYRPISYVQALINTQPQSGAPQVYALHDLSSTGVPKILCWPQDGSTLLLKSYVRKMPELIDTPQAPAPTVMPVVGGPLSGSYSYTVTNVTALGETEGGPLSATIIPATDQVSVVVYKQEYLRTLTARRIYRTAAGGYQHKLLVELLVATAPAYLDYTYTDTIADASLGANVPQPAAAVSGLEVFPSMFHESALYDGLVAWLAEGGGDGREPRFSEKWDQSVRRLWQEVKPGQNIAQAFPPFPGYIAGHPMWSRFSPPQ